MNPFQPLVQKWLSPKPENISLSSNLWKLLSSPKLGWAQSNNKLSNPLPKWIGFGLEVLDQETWAPRSEPKIFKDWHNWLMVIIFGPTKKIILLSTFDYWFYSFLFSIFIFLLSLSLSLSLSRTNSFLIYYLDIFYAF